MSFRKGSIAVILVTIVVWLGWDIPAALSGEDGGTLSEVIGDSFMNHPFMFGGGFLMLVAHFWYVGYRRKKASKE